ncbi:MAG: cell division protein FtsZ [Bacteroidetes bacterium]|uniref:Cell division protein FtsZ n=1 Tax=Candidatus Cryptobacteroides merdavium TaxID=2840769 RepID=A0A9D9ECW6_9BACT|nr:cell division protein FtsZ [Candidatus Cryptobacteroides merdavium]
MEIKDFIEDIIVPADWSEDNSIIKVIGVGGGGCNAVSYMYNQKIEGCRFIVCNTDAQALRKSPVPTKVQLGEGLGAGTDPIKGRNAAIEAQDEIARQVLDNNTQMLFITAGMGGGTGTGAAPVIAEMAKKRNILTVAIVTLPFKNEGNESLSKAIDGIHELEKSVDSLLIINNEKLYEYYGDLLVQDAFPKADEILATAVKGIIEIIQKPGYINVDFADVKTMMKNSGMALMGCGSGTGEHRIEDAIKQALESPLLNDFDLKTAKNVLINITIGKNEKGLSMKGLDDINTKIKEYTGNANNFKRGIIFDENPEAGDRISITAIATGFKMSQLSDITDVSLGNIIVIDNDDWDSESHFMKEEVELSEATARKIGPTNTTNIRKFNFSNREKPVLIVRPGQSISELELESARTRAIRQMSETSESGN